MQEFHISGIDHIHYYVGNAKQAAMYYLKLYGFDIVAYRGLETGEREIASYVLRQGDVRFVLSTPYTAESTINDQLKKHGDAVKDIAFLVDNLDAAYSRVREYGANIIQEPMTLQDDHGQVRLFTIQAYGDTHHTFVERKGYRGAFMPGFVSFTPPVKPQPTGFTHIDHIVGNQPEGEMEKVVNHYQKILHFHRFWTVDDKDIHTEYSSLKSIVVADPDEVIKMPINEPAPGKRKSQIQEYIEYNNGPGVQHIALYTSDIVQAVTKLKKNGVEFLEVPDSYYDALSARVGEIGEDIEELRNLGILVDRDEHGYLLQIFTKPVQDRPTLFYEVIQRKGSRSFGKGNFKALFEAIEREQERRGNL
ncbi:MAG: 4-hydroxyphenylpyruvate dioxygenase [Calditrichia bacterium]